MEETEETEVTVVTEVHEEPYHRRHHQSYREYQVYRLHLQVVRQELRFFPQAHVYQKDLTAYYDQTKHRNRRF
jgi:hypothetical protein